MKTYFNIFAFLFLISQSLLANESPVVEEVKVLEKTYNVNSNANLNINNKYGNVTMTTWDKNVIEIRVEIKVDGRDNNAVKEKLNSITVDFSGNLSNVSAITKINNIKGGKKTNISIHYSVKLPKTNSIELRNQYGNLFLDELKGSSNINVDYGNITIGKLHNALNNINLDYVTSAKIDYVKSAVVNIDYSKLEINKAEVLTLNADYTDVTLGDVNDLINNMDYGNLSATKLDKVSNTADYTNIKIGTLTHSFVSSGDYGAISIQRVSKGFDKIIINSDYSGVNIGIDGSAGYSIIANMQYGDLKYPSNVTMSKKIIKNSSSYYEGKTANATGSIEIKMSYGGAKISN
ncbi:hypothetical protein [Moheibacter sediminis]|uniref:Adhesin n=1 Tax=Moheibacter sediminis TaxID=1434700 RepID=A0A1W2AZ39_9FLAO|nr:hypothetical protein [Moheibacter sediminis]SMC66007.1 hypothetical protein SAMN06296427_105161 [Moheibacter sediminis]